MQCVSVWRSERFDEGEFVPVNVESKFIISPSFKSKTWTKNSISRMNNNGWVGKYENNIAAKKLYQDFRN